mgnify:CR=1 FL=1
MSQEISKPIVKPKFKIKKPTQYKVIFFNDDFTPFDFVHQILMVIFNKTGQEAEFLAKQIHNEGAEIVGVYPLEIAETKQAQTLYNAKKNGYPLKCELEECEEEE